jgi:MOSC domain-containing protein YiiM
VKVVSVNVSAGVTLPWRGREVATGICKRPVAGRVMARRTNLDGDRQSDLAVHGGPDKAVYGYALEHYDWWRTELGRDLPPGMFGENLTLAGLPEEEICVGDRFRVGRAVLEAVQPRLPCHKLGLRFGDDGMVRRFLDAGRFGVYFRVVEEGEVGAGDLVERLRRDPDRFPVRELARLLLEPGRDPAAARRALGLRALPAAWAETLRQSARGAPR